MDVESVADELYGLPLDEFTPARTVREKQARSAGNKELAAQIHQLAKPSLVAWLANQLVREHGDEIPPLMKLGEALREATSTSSGEQLRELSRQQQQLVSALVRQAERIAKDAGRKVSSDNARGLEDTLRAALADPNAAEALATGRLTEGMQNSGFGELTGPGPRPRSTKEAKAAPSSELASSPELAPSSEAAPPPTTLEPRPERRKRAELAVAQAQSVADEANGARQEAQTLLDAADKAVADTAGRVARARQELNEATQAQSMAQRDQRRARAVVDRADRSGHEAQKRLADATARLNRLAR